jgi:hypothetical protein
MFNMQQLWFFLYIWWIKDLFLRLFIVDLICVRYKRRNGWRTTVVLMDFVDLFKIEISSSTIICLLWSVTSMTKGSGVNIIDVIAYVPRLQHACGMHILVNTFIHIVIRLPGDNYLVLNGYTYFIYIFVARFTKNGWLIVCVITRQRENFKGHLPLNYQSSVFGESSNKDIDKICVSIQH